MNRKEYVESKVWTDVHHLRQQIAIWRFNYRTIIFTNGCFDVLHPGHFHLLNSAASLAEKPVVIVGLNSDASVSRLKGAGRPVHAFHDRAIALASLYAVDAVIGFEEDTPKLLIEALAPNILVKGGDYTLDEIVGADFVMKNGGKVELVSYMPGHSTTTLISGNK
jgi:rfaE bifunctional protein nucleotidyltransferase chain/domain